MAVLAGPFLMVDDSWGQCVQLEVGHAVRTDDHATLLFIKLVDNGLQGCRTALQIITIKLYGKAAASSIVDGQVPTAADAEVVPLRNDMD